jgi:hypothetical protein
MTGHLDGGYAVLLSSIFLNLELRVNREKEIIMSKFLQKTPTKDVRLSSLAAKGKGRILSVLFGSVALIALMSATPVAPAFAQGVPAGLLRLDPPQASNDGRQLTEDQRAKVRGAYARSRKPRLH